MMAWATLCMQQDLACMSWPGPHPLLKDLLLCGAEESHTHELEGHPIAVVQASLLEMHLSSSHATQGQGLTSCSKSCCSAGLGRATRMSLRATSSQSCMMAL